MPAPQPTIDDDKPESPGSDDPDPSRTQTPAPTPTPHENLCIDLVLNTDEPDPPITDWLVAQLRRAAERAGVRQANLTIGVVEDQEMAQLHEQYTGVAGTTDVLTFDLNDTSAHGDSSAPITTVEGDIIVCIDEARRQADERQHPLRNELLLYAIHGLLHLLGEDDHTDADYQRMHQREDELLQALGLGPVFKPKPNPHPQTPNPES